MAVGKEKNDPSKTSAAHDLMAPRIALMNVLMGGTEALRSAGEDYLPKHAAESDNNYRERLGRSVLVNYFRRSVLSLVGKPFSNPIILEDDMPPALVEISEDIDHQGNHINVFASNVFQDGLLKGLTHILVDYPNTVEAGVATKEDEVNLNATPYFIHIAPENILAAYAEQRNGKEFLTHVRIYEEDVERDGFDEIIIQRVRVLEPGKWQLWRKGAKNKWSLESEGITSLDYIPLFTFYADREGFMTAHPPLTDLAWVNIAHWQSSSDQTNILTVARFPMLAASGVNEDEAQVKVGPRQLLTTQSADGKYYYVEHTGAAIESGRQHLEDLKEEMSILGIELLKKTGDATATAKAIDTAENLSMLQKMTLMFSDILEQAYQAAADWLKLGKSGSVRINTDFGLALGDQTDQGTLLAARTGKEISHKAFVRELQRRKILADDFDMEADQAELDAEKEQAMVDLAFQVKMEQEGVLPKQKQPGQPDPNKE